MKVGTRRAGQQGRSSRPRLRSVVVATDFSADAEAALRRAALLPFEPRGRLVVLHVLPSRFNRATDSVGRSAAQYRLDAAVESLRARLAARRRTDVRVAGRLIRGSVPDEVGRLARLTDADLVVLGRRGKRVLRERLLGSVAERVARHARQPVLIVAPMPEAPYRSAILGFDLSSGAGRAARLVIRIVPPGAKVVVVHAFQPPYAGSPAPTGMRKTLAKARIATEVGIRRSLPHIEGGPPAWPIRLRQGDPRRVILDSARRTKADLIVLGSLGRSGLARRLIGSTAEGVLHQAPVDVLIVPSP